jgi:multidrug efflux system outer membrane protein
MWIKNKMMKQFYYSLFFESFQLLHLVGPDYKRPEINVPNAYHQEPNKENVVTDLNNWWKLYQDPVLNELMDKALSEKIQISMPLSLA